MRVSNNFIEHYILHIIDLLNRIMQEGENSFSWKEKKAIAPKEAEQTADYRDPLQ